MSDTLLRLFGYEFGYKDLIERPWLASAAHGQSATDLDREYSAWEATKRKFSRDEIPGCYVLVGNNGQASIRWLHQNGDITEKPLFNQKEEWGGSWDVTDGALYMRVDVYTVTVLASKEGNMHGGIQLSNSNETVYFKVIRVQE